MTAYQTPEPVVVDVDLGWGDLHVVASERSDTHVEVLPADPEKPADVRAAADAAVDLVGDVLTVRTTRGWLHYTPFGGAGQVEVLIRVPEGSEVRGAAGAGRLLAEGAFGAVGYRTGAGDVRVDEAERVTARTSSGSIIVGRATGAVELTSSAGSIRIRELSGEALIKNPNGSTTIGEVTGTLVVRGAHGDVTVADARGSVTARTSHGNLLVERIDGGSVRLEAGYGGIEVGVAEGTAAWLDVSSQHGAVRNTLQPADAPDADETTVELHARTSWGDILIRRPSSAPAR
ncbi:DUF4097 family beta strand repeat-containing protein [Agromyces sp. SYSU T0242]|uniref:DUF4097 family beta strand repeat-containing protein n=1 Tax=Agromyces litoreus TaxID=3158561 RepID=UPI003394CD41